MEQVSIERGSYYLSHEAGQRMIERFVAFAQVSDKTAETYLRALRQMYLYFMRNAITQPQEEDLIMWRSWLQESGKKSATIRLYVTAMRLFFSWTERENIYPNIAKHIKSEKISREPKKDYLTTAQIKKVLETVNRDTLAGKRDYAILLLAVTDGLREIEITRADVKDLTTRGNNTVLWVQGKGEKEKNKCVKVPAITETAIREYLKARGTSADEEPLFMSMSNNNKSGRISTRAISGMIKARLREAGFDSERLTGHSLRHSAVTISLLEGADITEVQSFARHANLTTTQIYIHSIAEENNSCSTRIAEAIV